MTNPSPTRRGLLAGAGALSAAGAVTTVPALANAATGADVELIQLCELFHQQHAELYSIDDDDWEELGDVLGHRRWATSDAIRGITPVTVEGFCMKAGVGLLLLAENRGIGEGGDSDAVFAIVVLQDLAGRLPIVQRSLRLIEQAQGGRA